MKKLLLLTLALIAGLVLLSDVALAVDLSKVNDCLQAAVKTKAKRNSFDDGEYYAFADYKTMNKDGDVISNLAPTVVDFAKEGVMVADFNPSGTRRFIYTQDTDYATRERFRNKDMVLYKRDGNYRYTTVTGATNAIPAYRATKYKLSDINYETYMNDKSTRCCWATNEGEVLGAVMPPVKGGLPRCIGKDGKEIGTFSRD